MLWNTRGSDGGPLCITDKWESGTAATRQQGHCNPQPSAAPRHRPGHQTTLISDLSPFIFLSGRRKKKNLRVTLLYLKITYTPFINYLIACENDRICCCNIWKKISLLMFNCCSPHFPILEEATKYHKYQRSSKQPWWVARQALVIKCQNFFSNRDNIFSKTRFKSFQT